MHADIRPGDSGGPLVDPSGRVVGIVTAASQTYQMKSTGGFAIPLDRALPIADAIDSGNASGSVHVGPTAILGAGRAAFATRPVFPSAAYCVDRPPIRRA